MPYYDSSPPVFFDSGATYDSVPPQTHMKILKIVRNWTKLALPQRMIFAKKIVDGTDANADLPTPNPTHAALSAAYTTAKTAVDAVTVMEQELKTIRAQMHEKVDALFDLIAAEVPTVESAAGGEASKIISVGFTPGDASPTPAGPVAKPARFGISSGENDGTLDWHCDAMEGATTVDVQTTETPDVESSWVFHSAAKKSSGTIETLRSGKRTYVRVRGIGAAGPGPWSDVMSKMVP